MTNIANRLIVIAAGALALGSMAYGQSRMTADVPFAFRTVSGTLPAGSYEIAPQSNDSFHAVVLRNAATRKAVYAGTAMLDTWKRAADKPVIQFACVNGACALKSIQTLSGTLEYAPASKSKKAEIAVISIPLKAANAD